MGKPKDTFYNPEFKGVNSKELFKIFDTKKDPKIREELICRHLYITEILSKKYINKGIDAEDIQQVASLGLIYAIDRYDVSKGFEFSSFATPTIIGEIKKYFRDKGWSIRVPRRIQELSKKINVSRQKLQSELQRVPTIHDIAEYLEITDEEVIEAIEASQVYSPRSLDITYENSGDDKDMQLQDIIGEEDKKFLDIENRDFIQNCMDKMNSMEIDIVQKRYFENKTQITVAKELNISQMTVSRLEKKIIKKFRKELSSINNL